MRDVNILEYVVCMYVCMYIVSSFSNPELGVITFHFQSNRLQTFCMYCVNKTFTVFNFFEEFGTFL